MKKQRLELTWIGKEERPRLEPRILLHDPGKSYHSIYDVPDPRLEHLDEEEGRRVKYENLLIYGDNLLALKALEQEFAGKVKCIFIDPPYNTGSAFTHYDDGLEHSLWLTMMRDRLELLRRLLSEDGSIWITIDDNEAHYLKVLCDEIFGRANFIANVIWQKTHTRENRTDISTVHDNVLLYAIDGQLWKGVRNLLPTSDEREARYSNPDDDPRGPWASIPAHAKAEKGRREAQFFSLRTPSGREITLPPGTCWRFTRERLQEMIEDNRIYFGPDGDNVPRLKKFLREVQGGLVPTTLWLYNEVGSTGTAKAEQVALHPNLAPFATPKPEGLIDRALTISTNPGDVVLDSFAGSGTTGAVAHKMGRRWIMVELGEHCHTHIIPRMKKVIDGEDQGGISKSVGWKGGGGFRYYKLAPTLIQKDKYGNDVINPAYNAEMLAEAMCKHMGFRYAPSDEIYWMHGQSTERDYIYVTTQPLTPAHLQYLNEEVGPERSLLICCTAFRGNPDNFENLTIKKIPKAVLGRCEFGRDDYSLEIRELPVREEPAEDDTDNGKPRGKERKKQTPSLFTQETGG
ncbi:site-specific DNA-methyltransferase [Fimbriimonadia bacterium ATM]|nr:MAG: site-specific DNA-methyltransferase [Armatimonadota bacterium]MBC6970480.1 site-specific DNA-methyltransferase [Armatimonadota bacterium]MCE7899657.1 site-specific DNA-methyltransferase [Armatimonadetes bacterium ATM1]MDL1927742.1 site-specific DNA-methyltransferase [Fimbriimonadia bacterium ATM]RIJ95354.1 MAG: site-specific DNA-methyltransferase [Armatimonadota bacterium]